MKIETFGKIAITERDGEPYIEISDFTVTEGDLADLQLFALRFASKAIEKQLKVINGL